MRSTGKTHMARAALAVLCNLLPVLLFYVLLVHVSYNLPVTPDDYHGTLHPVTELRTIPSVSQKFLYWLGAQHNEYKLWFGVAVAWLQSSVTGSINFRFLSLLGDAFMLPLGWLVWLQFPRKTSSWTDRLLWFSPVTILLFELTNFETLNWPGPGLQNVPVVIFACYAIYFLLQSTRGAFALSLMFFALAVASSGNGLLLVPIGCLPLLMARRYGRLLTWLGLSLALILAYSYHYDTYSSQVAAHRSIFVTMLHINLIYMFAFLGSTIGLHGCVLLGMCLSALNVWLWYTGFFRRHPVVGYCSLFAFFTALGVAGIRSELGIGQAASSRYRMYSTLLLCFMWLYLVEVSSKWRPLARRRLLAAALVVTSVLAVAQDRHGYKYLRARKQYAFNGIEQYKQSLKNGTHQGPVAWTPSQPDYYIQNNEQSRIYLQEAERTGTFRIP